MIVMNSLQACKCTKGQIYFAFILIQVPCNSSNAGRLTPAEHVVHLVPQQLSLEYHQPLLPDRTVQRKYAAGEAAIAFPWY